jgi:hypothetical protein
VQPVDVETEAHGGVADDLVKVAHGQVVVADVAYGGAGRGVDVEAGVLAELADAEEVSGVGDDDDVTKIVFVGNGCEAVDLLLGIGGAGFGDDAAEGNSVGEEIVATDAPFGVAGVFVAATTEGDDERGDLLVVEIDGVIEAGVQDGRRVAGVLGCTEDGDGIGGLGVVLVCDCGYLTVDPDTPCSGGEEEQQKQLAKEVAAERARSSQVGRGGDHLD